MSEKEWLCGEAGAKNALHQSSLIAGKGPGGSTKLLESSALNGEYHRFGGTLELVALV
ncbi:MAG: hypothetical protein NXI19_16630 [Alphaproteobacteria bacterium]|nr:hypothetical protein [Alphaproteobacteria bacterium]